MSCWIVFIPIWVSLQFSPEPHVELIRAGSMSGRGERRLRRRMALRRRVTIDPDSAQASARKRRSSPNRWGGTPVLRFFPFSAIWYLIWALFILGKAWIVLISMHCSVNQQLNIFVLYLKFGAFFRIFPRYFLYASLFNFGHVQKYTGYKKYCGRRKSCTSMAQCLKIVVSWTAANLHFLGGNAGLREFSAPAPSASALGRLCRCTQPRSRARDAWALWIVVARFCPHPAEANADQQRADAESNGFIAVSLCIMLYFNLTWIKRKMHEKRFPSLNYFGDHWNGNGVIFSSCSLSQI